MAGDRYAKVHSRFWIEADIKALGRDARELYLYLISSPHSNMAGYFYLPISYVVEDLETDEGFPNGFETVRKGFQTLIQSGKISYDQTTKVVLLRNFFAWDPPQNPNQVKGILGAVAEVPQSLLLPEFVACAKQHLPAYGNQFETLLERFRNGSGTVSKSGTVTGTVTGTEDTPSGPAGPVRLPPVPDARREISATDEKQKPKDPPAAVPPKADPKTPAPNGRKSATADAGKEDQGPKWSEAARRLGTRMYERLQKKNALPSNKSRFYQEQTGKAQAILDKGRTEAELNACFDWAETHRFWGTRMKDWGQVDIEVWPQFQMEVATRGGRSEGAGGHVGTGPGARTGEQYDRLSE